VLVSGVSCFAHWVDRRAAGFWGGGECKIRAATLDLVRPHPVWHYVSERGQKWDEI